jgi:hypothetical protein
MAMFEVSIVNKWEVGSGKFWDPLSYAHIRLVSLVIINRVARCVAGDVVPKEDMEQSVNERRFLGMAYSVV